MLFSQSSPRGKLIAHFWNSKYFSTEVSFRCNKAGKAESPNEFVRATNLKQRQKKAKRLKEIFPANQLEKPQISEIFPQRGQLGNPVYVYCIACGNEDIHSTVHYYISI